MRIDLQDNAQFIEVFASAIGKPLEANVSGIVTDSREVQKGDLYIAIPGERVDGHSFLADVFKKGASCALVNRVDENINGIQIKVENPVKAIGKVSTAWRNQFDIPIVGITGSNGKTSTKELLKHILTSNFNVHATEGNYNTSIGLPLTLLQLNKSHTLSILEMGANQPGDIAELCDIAHPTHGMITNIAPAHLEGFGTIETVAETKGALFQSLKDGLSFLNAADHHIIELDVPGESVSFGLTPDCDYPADIHHEEGGTIILTIDAEEVTTYSTNLSFAKNVIACSAIARELGIKWQNIKDRIASFQPPKGRCEVKNNGSITIIDDTYNANLESTVAAIDYLKAFSGNGNRIFVFGDMFELGASSFEQHRSVGEKCDEAELSAVLTVGNETISTDAAINEMDFHRHFENKDDLLSSLKSIINEGDKVLVKGSRGMEMETIVEAILEA
ncbi:MAG: UDP-N-acetylmuramoyl-tripeptide--D-alanyl-D-alanine ligase [Candidatus Marinimicrobia bacterium]|jgi:UDP-N-acetylmuramoyl-tripeptide--D-alanyl-D-alanine ligase|nr:UDP-N-acetylmuramoyl-tripeptide--D-alanyl-D-alanine ligase [Candidatus Neomarinimicrobiota bacterium]MDP6611705.1 UDP-N-acetylmuramoyl-tripeptide--D-alanyl-D-alanine ligase [Candidatus Neomarinimicrobiota bacterium]|tara:strand:+ start:32509 stop:33849 length:1341 start_codon:yes stop_codon:yes gene_type:complete